MKFFLLTLTISLIFSNLSNAASDFVCKMYIDKTLTHTSGVLKPLDITNNNISDGVIKSKWTNFNESIEEEDHVHFQFEAKFNIEEDKKEVQMFIFRKLLNLDPNINSLYKTIVLSNVRSVQVVSNKFTISTIATYDNSVYKIVCDNY